MFAIIQAVGWPIWPLILASVIAVALIIERSITLRRSRIVPPGLLDKVLERPAPDRPSGEMVERVAAHSPLGRVLAAGLRNVQPARGDEGVHRGDRARGGARPRALPHHLGTIASISPLMGLLGTIIGMIDIFASQGVSGANPAQLAQGISIALYTTGLGLIIAIPAMIFWRHFRALIDSFVIDMEQQAIKLVEVSHGERRA